ncbi:MAG: hypothetical protein FOGNACKC_04330 [Anaerolineae bacterium]|nr:hypothetical protein [Anaerolineae bacterium]
MLYHEAPYEPEHTQILDDVEPWLTAHKSNRENREIVRSLK